jgi:hypothetical protein
MQETPKLSVRVAPELEAAAREAVPELASADVSTIIRVGLLVLAGHQVPEALSLAKNRRGPKGPRTREVAA